MGWEVADGYQVEILQASSPHEWEGVVGQAQLACCDLVRPDWQRNGATVSDKLDCYQGVGKHAASIFTNGSCHGKVQTVDKTKIVPVIVSMDVTMGVDMIALE